MGLHPTSISVESQLSVEYFWDISHNQYKAVMINKIKKPKHYN